MICCSLCAIYVKKRSFMKGLVICSKIIPLLFLIRPSHKNLCNQNLLFVSTKVAHKGHLMYLQAYWPLTHYLPKSLWYPPTHTFPGFSTTANLWSQPVLSFFSFCFFLSPCFGRDFQLFLHNESREHSCWSRASITSPQGSKLSSVSSIRSKK